MFFFLSDRGYDHFLNLICDMGPPLSIAPVRDGPRQAAEGQSLHFGNWISLCLQLTYIVLRF